MGQAIPRQHPAVVLRSHYRQLKALLAITMVAVVGLSVAVVMLATNDDATVTTSSAKPIESVTYEGLNPQTGSPLARGGFRTSYQPVQSTRPAGGPDESGVAAAIAPKPNVATPDESKIAAAISRRQQLAPSRPDESGVAAAIAGH
jgi:hypothetical protein